MAPLILLVEDEPHIANIQLAYFKQAGMRTHWIDRGDTVSDWVRSEQPDLVILDLMLPGLDGTEVCRQLRTFTQVPIIMVTARVDELDRLLGFDVGADDYVCKPFSARELMARVNVALRRHAPPAAMAEPPCPLRLDEPSQRATWNNQLLDLTPQQYRLLATLAAKPGQIFSRARLLELSRHVDGDISDRAIDSLVRTLRKNLAQQIPGIAFVHSVYGLGYRFEIQDEPPGT